MYFNGYAMNLFKKEKWITVEAASDILKVSSSRIYVLLGNGRFRFKSGKFYKRYQVSAEDVEQYRIERESV